MSLQKVWDEIFINSDELNLHDTEISADEMMDGAIYKMILEGKSKKEILEQFNEIYKDAFEFINQ